MIKNAAAVLAASLALYSKESRKNRFMISSVTIVKAADMGTFDYVPDLFMAALDMELRLRGFVMFRSDASNFCVMRYRRTLAIANVNASDLEEYVAYTIGELDARLECDTADDLLASDE